MSYSQKRALGYCGQIGGSWALLFASAGYKVAVYDSDSARLSSALEVIQQQLQSLSLGGLLRGSLTVSQQFDRIQAVDSLQDCVEGAHWIQECITEDADQKRQLFAEIDSHVSDSAIIASSTSSYLPSQLSSGLAHKVNFIVAHPVNPPFYTRAVELVPAPWTSDDVMTRAKRMMVDIGQAPLALKREIRAFVLNRLQYAIVAESYRLVKNGVLTVDGVNKLMSAGLGRRYAFLGPFQTAHLNAVGYTSYCERYGEMIYRVQQDLGPPVPMEGKLVGEIERELVKEAPLDRLGEARRERERRLGALIKLKQELSARDCEDKK